MKKTDPAQKLFPFAQGVPSVMRWDDIERLIDVVNPADCERLIAPMQRIQGSGIILAASEQVYRQNLQAVQKDRQRIEDHLRIIQALEDW